MTRGPLLKVVAFFVIGILAAVLVGAQTMSRDVIGGGRRVTVELPDAGGLLPASLVTYRGVKVGTVSDMEVREDGSGVIATLSITTDTPIPASARAVVTMDTPVAIQHIDLQPDTSAGPFLEDGARIPQERTERPLPLTKVLADSSGLLRSVSTDDLHKTADELAIALQGMGPQLQSLMANSTALIDTADTLTPKIIDLTAKGNRLLKPTALLVSRLPELAGTVRDLTGQISGQLDNVTTVVDKGTEFTGLTIPLLHENQEGVAALLANGAALTPVFSSRVPALTTGFITIPAGLNDLASIFKRRADGGVQVDLRIVTTLGPACYYDSKRRLPQDTAPMPVEPDWSCPGDRAYLQQRGAANAPTPGGVGAYQPRTGAAGAGPASPAGQSPILGARPWESLLLQGVQ